MHLLQAGVLAVTMGTVGAVMMMMRMRMKMRRMLACHTSASGKSMTDTHAC
jgi:hypothetical protein